MSTELQPAAAEQQIQLENLLPESCALTWSQFAFVAFALMLFLVLSYLPVSSPITWQCINEAAFQSSAEKAAILPLAEGIRTISIGQFGKQAVAAIYQVGGAEYVGLSFAAFQLIAFGLWSWIAFRISANRWSLLVVAVCAVLSLSKLDGFHTGVFGQICGGLLVLNLLTTSNSNSLLHWKKASRLQWTLAFLIMVVWANLDASFVFGLGGLAIIAASQFWNSEATGKVKTQSRFPNAEFRSRVWLLELGFVATLLTPNGIGLWKSMFWSPDNPLTTELGFGQPELLASRTTLVLFFCWSVWATIALKSRQPVSKSLAMLAISSTVVVCLSPDMITWFLLAMSLAIVGLISNSASTNATRVNNRRPTGSVKFTYTLLTALAIWMAFCFSPLGTKFLGGTQRSEAQILGTSLPVEGKKFLQQNQASLLHCPVRWSDWLAVDTGQPLMVNQGTHNMPATVRYDHREIYQGGADWRKIADKYELSCLFVDKVNQKRLIRNLRRSPGDWQQVHQDAQCIIYRRDL